ncbi:Ribonuclease T2 family protein [Sulfitobacter noctilucae]|uniref:ribonuclease T2 family protein n=1 Tax=Sulfitobacter noctilucae TaxID=1342302 RepID=UPI00046AA8B7|nr:ribonuclease T2 [Sulfitobacter noctilucae]KIN65376.1 Ribonuclease T2 family protein [Sulfitobacter noctilucae]
MRRLFGGLTAALIALSSTLHAEGDRPGTFDYYVLALSWSPNWCLREGDARNSPQCDTGTGHGWIMHGLWPQFHRGYPSFCQTAKRPPSRGMTAQMADIMGTSGLAWHQWKKHGTCTGLSATDYYTLSREAYARVVRPEIFRQLKRSVNLPASVIEEAFLKANPSMEADGVTITCNNRQIQEARICLSKTLEPVPCGQDVVRDCSLKDAIFSPIR